MTDVNQEHPAISLIRKYVDEAQFDPSAQQQAPQPQAPEAAPQGAQAMDFAGEQGASPDQQIAMNDQQAPIPVQTTRQPPQEMPQPQQAPQQQLPQTQFAQQLSPTSIINANHQNVANNEGVYDQGAQMQAQGNNGQAAIDMANNDAKAKALPQLNQLDSDYAATRNAIDEHHMTVTHQAVDDMENTTQQQMKMAQENPYNWWGNASVGSKISAVIGMVGAGLAHQNASEYFQKIVDNSVAESERKERVLNNVYRMQDHNRDVQDKIRDNQVANLDAKKAAAYQLIANQVSQQIALTKNPAVAAQLQKQQGELLQKVADHKAKGAQNMVGNDLSALRAQVELDRLQYDKQQASVSVGKSAVGRDDDIRKQAMLALKGNPELNRVDQRIAQLEPAIALLRNNPNATGPQIQQIMLQVLNGEIGGRVPAELLNHMTPNSYMQKFQEMKARLTNNPQDSEAKKFIDKTADIAQQTLDEVRKQKHAKRHEILRPLEPDMSQQLRTNLDYDDPPTQESAMPTPPTAQQQAQSILDKYK